MNTCMHNLDSVCIHVCTTVCENSACVTGMKKGNYRPAFLFLYQGRVSPDPHPQTQPFEGTVSVSLSGWHTRHSSLLRMLLYSDCFTLPLTSFKYHTALSDRYERPIKDGTCVWRGGYVSHPSKSTLSFRENEAGTRFLCQAVSLGPG